MKNNVSKKMAFVLVVLVLIALVGGCSSADKGDVEALMSEFEYACNTLDIDAMLDCIDPDIADGIRLSIGLAGMFSEVDSADLVEEFANLVMDNGHVDANAFFSSINIEVEDVSVEKDTAVVEAIVEYSVSSEDFKKMATFECVNYMNEWYISYFMFN